MAAFGAGMALTHFVPSVKRLLAGRTLLRKRVSQRAAEAFIAEEVFDTRERTGILLFVSLFERHVLVVGDSGINTHVKQEEWDDVVRWSSLEFAEVLRPQVLSKRSTNAVCFLNVVALREERTTKTNSVMICA